MANDEVHHLADSVDDDRAVFREFRRGVEQIFHVVPRSDLHRVRLVCAIHTRNAAVEVEEQRVGSRKSEGRFARAGLAVQKHFASGGGCDFGGRFDK